VHTSCCWLQGGPGSSSLIGFLTENGPFMLDDASVVSPTDVKLIHRETGWQKAASYIFLESPAGTLFSYPYGHIMRGDINVLLSTVLEGMSRSIRVACVCVLGVRVTGFTWPHEAPGLLRVARVGVACEGG
jgi:hypothetical protein